MTLTFIAHPGSVSVSDLKYGDCFLHSGRAYMRIGPNSRNVTKLNTASDVAVLRMSNGRYTMFKRGTKVLPIEIKSYVVRKGMDDV